MNPVFIFLPALLLLTPRAEAANWHTLPGGAQMTLQADQPQLEATDKDKKKDKRLKVWDKITYSRLHQAILGDFYYTSAKSLTEINCTARTLKPLLRLYYDSDGNEVKSIHYRSSEPAEAVVPDTPGEAVFNFACAFKAASAVAKTAPRTKSPVQTKASPPPAKPDAAKEKTKEQKKPQPPIGTKPSPPLAPSALPAKSADTKKTVH
ncbi:hypothetical protein SKTS_25120 [Sulfurimicrobium lacus]|uniref:Surface-adhesin protein E-like domain-containing protein n=1 Tax=Sulfurimicrobium lacus TaxID=2715678 RepID=A0A6F8VF22_9PROT|nr:surface-adhesin E family protein [Sulfurimicrobium lacus]BCB27626.1 hypothetical protein SKTS_25120 [Sulfurimicrobium lacus]